ERAGARARAEAAPGAETLQAGNRKAHREARAAGDEEDRLNPREPTYPRRSRARSTFPRWVRGSASRKVTSRGYLYGSSRSRTNACSSSASPSRRSLTTTKACGLTSPCSPRTPTTATSCTAGCSSRQFSTSCGASHLPDTLSRSSARRSEEHTSELQSPDHLVCRLLLENKDVRYSCTRQIMRWSHLRNGLRVI